MSNIIYQKFSPQTTFEGLNNIDKLCKMFSQLYRIDLYKDGLDLILTKLSQKQLNFEVKIIKDWDTNIGCFLTEQQGVFDKTIGKFFAKKNLKIILRQLSYNVLAHEMAHAVDFESGLDLNDDFRQAIYLDLRSTQPTIITLKSHAHRLMIEAVKSYPKNQIINELFARYFELLSISRDVCTNGDFSTNDVMNYFANTTKYITEILNPFIKKQIDQIIANQTISIVSDVKINNHGQNYREKIDSFHQKQDSDGQKSWAKNTKSNHIYHNSWNKYQALNNNKDNQDN
jgi:predicted secreted protein